MNDLSKQFSNGEFQLSIEPHPVDGFRVLAPGLAKSLSVDSAANILRSIPEEEKGYSLVNTLGGQQNVGHVTEAGFYRAIGQRQIGRIQDPTARTMVERFQNWVYREVLPSIRATGGYAAAPSAELTPEVLMAKALIAADSAIKSKALELEAAQPAVDYNKRYVSNDDAVLVAAFAAQHSMTSPAMFNLLKDAKIVRRLKVGEHFSERKDRLVEDHEYRAYAPYLHLFDLRPQHNAPRYHNGQVRQTLYVRQAHALELGALIGLGEPSTEMDVAS